ncbi:MAG: magnesium transporter CorA family protein [Clostridiaceae bacterium]
MKLYKSTYGKIMEVSTLDEKNLWIELVNPTEAEISLIGDKFGIRTEFLKASLDYDESSRIDIDDEQVLILVNMPIVEHEEMPVMYNTVPFGIIITDEMLVTVSLEENQLTLDLIRSHPEYNTNNRTRLALELLYNIARLFLKYLKDIDKRSVEIEQGVKKSLRNEELVKLLNLEKSLVYFTTSLKSNEFVLERFKRFYVKRAHDKEVKLTKEILDINDEDEEFLEDVIIENKQAIDMADVYSNILGNTMDAFATIISNNLNIVMKFLAIITLVLAIPSIITSYYGMNIALPYQTSPLAYLGIIVLSCIVMVIVAYILIKKKY